MAKMPFFAFPPKLTISVFWDCCFSPFFYGSPELIKPPERKELKSDNANNAPCVV